MVTYFYPYTSPTLTLELRNPELNNREVLYITKHQSKSRGGTLNTFRASYWTTFRSLEYAFSFLKYEDYQNILVFFTTSLGKEIGLTDYEGRTWKGIISNPQSAVAQNGKHDYSALIQFQGELISW